MSKRLASRLLDGMAQTAADGDRSGFKGGPQFSWSAYVVGPAPENKRYSYQELKAYVEELDAARD